MRGTHRSSTRRRALTVLFGCAWLALVGFGLKAMFDYEQTPGIAAAAPRIWPTEAAFRRSPGRFTLIMAVHPQCPCSRVSIAELATLMAGRNNVDAYVLAYAPKNAPASWMNTNLCLAAARIPNVHLLRDENAEQAGRFHAVTSGQTILFDQRGKTVFSGGITEARGHVGENAGSRAIASVLAGGIADIATTPVFGCALQASSSTARGVIR